MKLSNNDIKELGTPRSRLFGQNEENSGVPNTRAY